MKFHRRRFFSCVTYYKPMADNNVPWAWPVWSPGAWLAGFIKRITKFNVGLITLLREGLSEPEYYGDLVYKFKKLIGGKDFSFQFRKVITRYRRIGSN